MPLLSTFELLVKPIAPTDNLDKLPPKIAAQLEKVARRVVQGYFLTIANTTNSDANIRLTFTATTPNLNLADTTIISDILNNVNETFNLTPVPGNPKKFTFNLSIPAHDTALVTLLPDLANLDLFTGAKNLEIRGYVTISRAFLFGGLTYDLLVTPEHRGTFLPKNLDDSVPDFDQIAYTLPTASGGSLVTLKALEITPRVDNSSATEDMQELISLMAERVDELEQRLESA